MAVDREISFLASFDVKQRIMREKKKFCYGGERERRGSGVRMPEKEIYIRMNFSGLSLVLKKEKDCDFKRHLSWVGYTPLVEVNQAILAWSF